MRGAIIMLWVLATFCLSIGAFTVVLTNFLTMSELWHQRIVESNVSYVLALFFVLFVALGHGLSAAYARKSSFTVKLYRIVLLPLGLGVALLSFFPIALVPASPLDIFSIAVMALWFFVSGVGGMGIGRWMASSLWFREKILIGRGSHRGMGGAFGFRMYNAGLLMILFAGILIR